MRALGALVAFSFVGTVTPGPNNVLLWNSGLQFGFRLTVPQILGTSAGIGALAVFAAAGLGALVTTAPGVGLALKAVGSAYLLFLAFRLAGSHAVGRSRLARPLRLREGAAFQFLNPKAWLFSLAAVSTFRPDGLPVVAGSAVVVVTMMVVVVPTAALWAAAGTTIDRIVASRRSRRAVDVVLAAMLAATIAFIWL